MPATKYKQYYVQMEQQNKAEFDAFQPIHDGFVQNSAAFETEFHTKGRDILDIIRDWERRLCSGMERGNHSQYSLNLSKKFWDEIKKRFSHVELIGVKVTKRS